MLINEVKAISDSKDMIFSLRTMEMPFFKIAVISNHQLNIRYTIVGAL